RRKNPSLQEEAVSSERRRSKGISTAREETCAAKGEIRASSRSSSPAPRRRPLPHQSLSAAAAVSQNQSAVVGGASSLSFLKWLILDNDLKLQYEDKDESRFSGGLWIKEVEMMSTKSFLIVPAMKVGYGIRNKVLGSLKLIWAKSGKELGQFRAWA
ncbi:hypothetical protein Drorol1_Dr00001005, partial [Drosera rotundifolia]